jgi:hypothetical protein
MNERLWREFKGFARARRCAHCTADLAVDARGGVEGS